MTHRSALFLVVAIGFLGVVLRCALAISLFPITGDPVYSYCYRSVLLANGQSDGLFLMWHPPGYPLLLAVLTRFSFGTLSPYLLGTTVSILSFVGLVLVVDRLVASRVRWQATRVVIASFLAFYEGLYLFGTGPLTEPIYLLLVYGGLLALDRDDLTLPWALLAGGLVGLATLIRMEGLAVLLGFALFLFLRWVVGFAPSGRRAWAPLIGFCASWVVISGWMFLNRDYLHLSRGVYDSVSTIPVAQGLLPQVKRAVLCFYHACTVWLPQTLLLPYWLLAAIGLGSQLNRRQTGRLNGLLLSLVLPSLVAVMWSIMHKRSGSFLLPAAAIWVGFGVEAVVRRLLLWRWRWGVEFAAGLFVVLTVLQASRVMLKTGQVESSPEPDSWVAAAILHEHQSQPGKTWAFGAEPEIYAWLREPIVYPFWARQQGYEQLYTDHENHPARFVESLRSAGFSYLCFALALEPNEPSKTRESQQYGWPSPLRADLLVLEGSPERFGLELIGQRSARAGQTSVRVYRVLSATVANPPNSPP